MIDIDYVDDNKENGRAEENSNTSSEHESSEENLNPSKDGKSEDGNSEDGISEDKDPVQEPAGEGEAADDPDEEEPSGNTAQETEDKEPSCEESSMSEKSSVEDVPGTEQNTEQKAKTSFFGRKKKDKETDKLQKQIDDLTDLLKRNRAEFDNFRKRTEKEKSGMYIIGARDIVEKMLPVVDSFERGLAQAAEGDAFADGMKLIYKQLMTALEEAGVKPIEAVGKEFDPAFHNAVMHVDDETAGDNIVVEEFQKGYTYKDSVIRHSMVKVAN